MRHENTNTVSLFYLPFLFLFPSKESTCFFHQRIIYKLSLFALYYVLNVNSSEGKVMALISCFLFQPLPHTGSFCSSIWPSSREVVLQPEVELQLSVPLELHSVPLSAGLPSDTNGKAAQPLHGASLHPIFLHLTHFQSSSAFSKTACTAQIL